MHWETPSAKEVILSRLWYVYAAGVWLLRQYTLCSAIEAEIVCWQHTESTSRLWYWDIANSLCVQTINVALLYIYTAGHGSGIFCVMDVNWNSLLRWRIIYILCEKHFYVCREKIFTTTMGKFMMCLIRSLGHCLILVSHLRSNISLLTPKTFLCYCITQGMHHK